MARQRDWRDALEAGFTGLATGYGSGLNTVMQAELEQKKELWKAKLKQNLQNEYLKKLTGGGNEDYDVSFSPSGASFRPVKPEEQVKREIASREPRKARLTSFLTKEASRGIPTSRIYKKVGDISERFPTGKEQSDITKAIKTGRELFKASPAMAAERKKRETLNLASSLRKEFNADATYKNYKTIKRSAEGLEAAYQLATSPDTKSRIAADQALGVLFQKMLDPTSVVRESEYARTPEGASFLNRLSSFAPQLQKGGLRLKDEDRMALVEQAKKLLESAQQDLELHIERYSEIARQYGVAPQLVVGIGNKSLFNTPSANRATEPPPGYKMQRNTRTGETRLVPINAR